MRNSVWKAPYRGWSSDMQTRLHTCVFLYTRASSLTNLFPGDFSEFAVYSILRAPVEFVVSNGRSFISLRANWPCSALTETKTPVTVRRHLVCASPADTQSHRWRGRHERHGSSCSVKVEVYSWWSRYVLEGPSCHTFHRSQPAWGGGYYHSPCATQSCK